LRDFHDAEDAFQATFLVLARKAGSVVKRESVGCWLYGVAYRTALEAAAASARRRARERPVKDVPHPQVAPPEAQDWRPLLDRELSGLPEKYRSAVVICDLEGRPRKETARQLGIPEGTLSSRLATARKMLAERLARAGLAISGTALAAVLSEGLASAQVSAPLAWSTARAAALVAAGQVAGASAPAVVLMQGVMKAMLLKKLRLVVGAVLVVLALGAVGVGYRAGDASGAAQAAPPDKPANELEALRKENELLKLNLQVVLEKVRAQEAELQTARKQVAAAEEARKGAQAQLNNAPWSMSAITYPGFATNTFAQPGLNTIISCAQPGLTTNNSFAPLATHFYGIVNLPAQEETVADAAQEAESAVKALREAKDKEAQKRAAEALEKAMKKLKERLK
jgi:RNA polymerase sigma factor (sigma-70 family)